MRISDWSSYVCSSDRASPKWRSNSPMAAKRLVAAIDQGTTSSRCILFDENACIVAMAQKGHRQIFPRPGWVEHDPAVLWHNVRDCVHGAPSRPGIDRPDLAAFGTTNPRAPSVVWRRTITRPSTKGTTG